MLRCGQRLLRLRLPQGHPVRWAGRSTGGAGDDEAKLEAPRGGLSSLPRALRDNLVGMGQVVFCNSAASGAVITSALFAGDLLAGQAPLLGSMSLLALGAATLAAKVAGVDDGKVKNGLASYNGALVGCAFAVFLPMQGVSLPCIAAASVAGGATTALLTVSLGNTLSMPQWTLAFNFTCLPALLYAKPFLAAAEVSGDGGATLAETADVALTQADWLCAPLVGISQIFVVENAVSGALVLGGIAAYSRGCAAHTLLGSSVGIATGLAMGAPSAELVAGLWSFNPALTSLAVSVFFVHSPAVMALSMGGAAATTVLAAGLGPVFGSFGSPALTLPFCLGVSACYMLGSSVAGVVPAGNPHSPELNAPADHVADTTTNEE